MSTTKINANGLLLDLITEQTYKHNLKSQQNIKLNKNKTCYSDS